MVALKHAALPGDRGVLNPLLEKWQDGVRILCRSRKVLHTGPLSHGKTSLSLHDKADGII